MSAHRLVLLTKPMAHHGLRAGYNVLTRYLEPDLLLRVNATALGRWTNGLTRRVLNRLTGVEWYGAAGLAGEVRAAGGAAWFGLHGQRTVVHVMYGEDLLWLLPRLLRANAKVVATFHQPPERFERLVRRTAHLEGLDGLIALDPSNAAALERLQPGRVHTLSLGVDADYWSPGAGPRERRRVLFVGNHLRDFEVLVETIRTLGPRGVAFDLVVPSHRARTLVDLPHTTIHVGIPDDELRDLYRRARLFFVPLKGGSANNAVLQALACGVPIVGTDLPGVRSYVPDGCGAFAEVSDFAGHAAALQRLIDDDAFALSAAAAARRQGVAMSWRNVADRHRDLYKRL